MSNRKVFIKGYLTKPLEIINFHLAGEGIFRSQAAGGWFAHGGQKQNGIRDTGLISLLFPRHPNIMAGPVQQGNSSLFSDQQ